MDLLRQHSPYSPFFTSGLLPLGPPRDDQLSSFLSLETAERHQSSSIRTRSSRQSLPSPKPAPSITLPEIPQPPQPSHARRTSTTTHSSVSPTVRRVNRTAALARLEGRTPSTRRRNFMSMSDDEDEDAPPPRIRTLNLETEDIVLPSVSTYTFPAVSAPVSPRHSPSRARSRRTKSRHQSTHDWFPLKSFIDLHAEDDMSSWAWRSFIEVATLS
ncbi:hypothetical protein BD779DRAFT_1510550 [Infundibulicybe gibba]|nr:hypothetical protein BD779DRAFT_1510550 [Infundibulicybe gibba]